MKDRRLAVILNILSFAAVLAVNYLAVFLPINNLTTREISDQFDVYFVPADYVFTIWSIIYIGLMAYVVFQALPHQRENQLMAKTDFWFLLSNVTNVLWLLSFHFQYFILSLLLMGLLIISIIKIYEIFEIGKKEVSQYWKWLVEVPFGIYLGWVTIAVIANVTQVLDYYKWDGFGIAPEAWFVFTVVIAVVLSALMSIRRKAFEFTLVIVWAFVGMALKFPQIPLVSYAAWGGAIAASVVAMLAFALKPFHKT